jgi:hypothetical protein
MTGSLFHQGALHYHFENLYSQALREVGAIPDNDIVAADPEQLAAEFEAKYRRTCPVLDTGAMSYDQPDFSGSSREVIVRVHVPFSGDGELFCYAGHYSPIIRDRIDIGAHELVLHVRVNRDRTDQLPQLVTDLVKQIDSGLDSIRNDLTHSNQGIAQRAKHLIQKRQTELASHAKLLGDLQSTGFKLRRIEDGTERIIIPVKPKTIGLKPAPGPAPKEPELSVGDYDEVLGVITSMVKVFERSPSAFAKMEEEHLRMVLLVALNGVFRGDARGETFNGEGKTDILIQVNDQNIFIGECLVWGGPEHFRKKLTEQLFRYATWRDSKLAVIVFNRSKNLTAVVAKMREQVERLPNKLSSVPYASETGFRHKFRRADDPQKEFLLTCLAFQVPE